MRRPCSESSVFQRLSAVDAILMLPERSFPSPQSRRRRVRPGISLKWLLPQSASNAGPQLHPLGVDPADGQYQIPKSLSPPFARNPSQLVKEGSCRLQQLADILAPQDRPPGLSSRHPNSRSPEAPLMGPCLCNKPARNSLRHRPSTDRTAPMLARERRMTKPASSKRHEERTLCLCCQPRVT